MQVNTDKTPSSPNETLFAPRSFAILLGCMLTAFAAVAVFSASEHAHRASLEKVQELTAVGDKSYFKAPPALLPAQPVLSWESRPLYIQRLKRFTPSDSQMLKAGKDDSQTFFLYRSAVSKVENGEGIFYVKIADQQFLQMGVNPPLQSRL